MMGKICSAFDVPVLFVEGVLDRLYWIKHGNGFFFHQNENGDPLKLGLSFLSYRLLDADAA
jgi:hypothetical protein